MNKFQQVGFVSLASLLLLLGILFPQAEAAEDYERLQIGIPDLPRSIRRELPPLSPDQELKVGILKLHPMFRSKIEFDDNIRLKDTDKTEDVIFTQIPALGVEMNLGKHRVEAAYGMEIVNFAKEEEENSINHLANGLLELNFNNLQLSFRDLLEKSTSRLYSETSERDELLINAVDVFGRYDRPQWAMEGGWRHNTIHHLKDTLKDKNYEEDILTFLAGYKIMPKTLLLIESDEGFVRYRRNTTADQNYWQIFTGLRGEVTERLAVTAKGGFQTRRLDEVPGKGRSTDFNGFVGNFDLLFNPDITSSLRMGYERTVRTSTFQDNGWYRMDDIFLTYRKRFLEKWVLSPRFGWQMNAYPETGTTSGITKRRDDKFWRASISLRYEIREWLSTGIAYRFLTRNSDIDPFDFENNRIAFDVILGY